MAEFQELTLKEKVIWRALFWSGISCMVPGFWFAAMFLADFNEVALTFGLVFIILAVALVTCGYFALFKDDET